MRALKGLWTYRRWISLATLGFWAVLYGLTWVDVCPHRSLTPPSVTQHWSDRGDLMVGASKEALRPPLPAVVAGYFSWRKEAATTRQPLFARATVFKVGNRRIGILSLELLLVPEVLASNLRQKAQEMGLDDLVVTATHTHSSFGGFDRRPVFEFIATGAFRQDIETSILSSAVLALRNALDSLQPARLIWTERVFPNFAVARSEGPAPDGRISLARFTTPNGAPIAQWVFIGAHPTTVPRNAGVLDGDFVGDVASQEESGAGIRLVFQSGGGNASASAPGVAPNEKTQKVAKGLEENLEALAALPSEASPVSSMEFSRAAFALPQEDVHRLRPSALWGVARQGLCRSLPARPEISLLQLGDRRFLFVPGEPTAGASAELERTSEGARTVSLADGYLSYIELPELVREGKGESKRQYFDASLLSSLQVAVKRLLATPAAEQKP